MVDVCALTDYIESNVNKAVHPYYKNNGFLELKATPDYNLSKLYPELAQQWHATKNKELTPLDVTPGSNRMLWWLCSRGHEWEAIINSSSRGHGCPYCAGQRITKVNNFGVKYPELAREWHPLKNKELTPYDVMSRLSLIHI